MQNIQEYLARFRELFSLPADSRAFYRRGSSWIRLRANKFGLLRLQRGEQFEGMEAELCWFVKDDNEIVLVEMEGADFDLAVLLRVAEEIGLPTSDPDLDPVRETDEYKQMVQKGEIILV